MSLQHRQVLIPCPHSQFCPGVNLCNTLSFLQMIHNEWLNLHIYFSIMFYPSIHLPVYPSLQNHPEVDRERWVI